MDDANDRLVIRVQDENLNRNHQAWWVYRLSTGERLTAFRPSDEMPGTSPKKCERAIRCHRDPPWVALWDQSGVILFDCSSQKWQQFSLPSALVNVHFGCSLALAPNGRELLLYYGGSTISRYELPRA